MSTETTIAYKLEDLIEAKADMKAAIESKGVTVTGGLSTYADAIREIDTEYIEGKVPDGTKFGWSSMTDMTYFDTSEFTDMNSMFYECRSLTTVPQFDTSNVTDMGGMFHICTSLTTVPQFDTSKVTSMTRMFSGCTNLTSVPLLDASKVNYFWGVFEYCKNLKDVGGFKNLGMQSYCQTTPWTFEECEQITRDSILNIFNNLYDRAAAGYSAEALYFHSSVINRLTDRDIAIATNKGWRIISQ